MIAVTAFDNLFNDIPTITQAYNQHANYRFFTNKKRIQAIQFLQFINQTSQQSYQQDHSGLCYYETRFIIISALLFIVEKINVNKVIPVERVEYCGIKVCG